MTLNRKKKAAIAAVTHLLKTEAEAAHYAAADIQAAGKEQSKPMLLDATGPWSMTGRLHQMQLRTMMQLKAFHGYSRC